MFHPIKVTCLWTDVKFPMFAHARHLRRNSMPAGNPGFICDLTMKRGGLSINIWVDYDYNGDKMGYVTNEMRWIVSKQMDLPAIHDHLTRDNDDDPSNFVLLFSDKLMYLFFGYHYVSLCNHFPLIPLTNTKYPANDVRVTCIGSIH